MRRRDSGELMATALQAAMVAEVQARYAIAQRCPRDRKRVRARMLDDCADPVFAGEARYQLPRRKWDAKKGRWEETFIVDWSIRFAESAIRAMGNVYVRVDIVHEDEERRMVSLTVMDLESNVTFSRPMSIAKQVERQRPREGQRIVDKRTNSKGQPVFIVEATEAEITQAQQAAISRALRTEGLRLVDAALLAECWEAVDETENDAEATKERVAVMVKAMASVGVTEKQVEDYLQHATSSCSSAELTRLRGIYQAIRERSTTWEQVVAGGDTEPTDDPDAPPPPAEKPAAKKENPVDALLKDVARLSGQLKMDSKALRAFAANNAIAIPADGITAAPESDLRALCKALQTEVEKGAPGGAQK